MIFRKVCKCQWVAASGCAVLAHTHVCTAFRLSTAHSSGAVLGSCVLHTSCGLCPLTQQHMDVHVAQLSPGCLPVISEITSAKPKGWKCCQGVADRGPLEVFKLTLSQVGTALSVTSNRRQWVLQHGVLSSRCLALLAAGRRRGAAADGLSNSHVSFLLMKNE